MSAVGIWGWLSARTRGPANMLPSLSLEQTAHQRWRRIVFSRYIALAILAIGAALLPALSDHRWYLVAYVVLVGFPYNRLVQRLVAEQGSPGRWVVITDVVLVVMTVPVSTATTLPVCLVAVSVVALGTITVGRREPAIATIVGTILLSIFNLTVGLPWGWLAPVALAITSTMIVINVGEVIESEREVRSKLVALIDGLDGMVWSRCPRTFEYDYVSSQAEALLGWPRQQWLEPGFWARHVHGDDAARVRLETQDATTASEDHELRYRFQAADGRWLHVHELVTVMPASGARPMFTQGITLDVTDAALAEQELRRLALHDGLTGLPNRTHLEDRLRVALPHLAATDARAALLVMDLDQFKEVNDALGHHVGDRLLVALADRLRGLDDRALVARLGGDEFAVLVEGIAGIAEAAAVADEIHALLDTPFELDDMRLQINASIGLAVYPDHAAEPATLTQRADVAMYMAKRSAADLAVYQADLDRSSVRRVRMLGNLRAALEEDQLELHFQPMIDLRTGDVVRAEALVRWNHPELGFLPPDEFIELAELSGAIHPLTRWVLREAVRSAVELRRAGHPMGIAANISVRNLYDTDLPAHVERILREAGLPPSDLMVELTETELMDDPRLAVEAFTSLAELGVGTAIDDFGTGYSSLAYLRELPVREIKVDRSFVTGMHARHDDLTIVRSMIDLGHNLGLQVVAEGLEHHADLDLLRRLGCDLAQGYLVSRPLTRTDLLTWLDARRARAASAGERSRAVAEM